MAEESTVALEKLRAENEAMEKQIMALTKGAAAETIDLTATKAPKGKALAPEGWDFAAARRVSSAARCASATEAAADTAAAPQRSMERRSSRGSMSKVSMRESISHGMKGGESKKKRRMLEENVKAYTTATTLWVS